MKALCLNTLCSLPVATGFDSFKTVLLGLSNMADGLPWPLKAIPQTISQLIAQAEVRVLQIPLLTSTHRIAFRPLHHSMTNV